MQKELQLLGLPQKPKRPLTTFFLFKKDHEQEIRKNFPKLSNQDLNKKMSELFKAIPASKLKSYQEIFEN